MRLHSATPPNQGGVAAFPVRKRALPRWGDGLLLLPAFLIALVAPILAQGPGQETRQATPVQERLDPLRPAHIVLLNGKVWTLEQYVPPVFAEGEEEPETQEPPYEPVITDDGMWVAEAVALRGSRIIGVGSSEQMRRMVREGYTRVIDLKGRVVLPGFIDNHTHFSQAGHLLLGLNLLDVNDRAEFRRRVKAASERLPAGAWLTGGDWGAYAQWEKNSVAEPAAPEPASQAPPRTGEAPETESPKPDSPPAPASDTPEPALGEHEGGFVGIEARRAQEGQTLGQEAAPVRPEPEVAPLPPFAPTRDWIDPVTGERPALISRFDREYYVANSAALKAAGITAETPDPSDGHIFRDENGEPTGLLWGTAATLVEDAIPPISPEQRRAEALRALDEARRYGVTSIHDNVGDFETLEQFWALEKSDELTVRVWARMPLSHWDVVSEIIRLFSLPASNGGWGSQYVRLGGLKGWVDGIMGNSTALFFEDYDNDPGNRGQLRDIMFPEGNLHQLIRDADKAGFTVTVHAIGDEANRILLDTYEKVFAENGERDRRFRDVHAQVVHPDDFERFGKLNLIAEVQPYHCIDDMRWMEERIGQRARYAYAFRSLQQAGAVLSFGSDWPGTNASYYPINPLLGIYAAVTRKTLDGKPIAGWYPEQRVSIEDAVRAYTLNNAYAAFEERIKGSIKDGKVADLVVLDRDIFTVPPEELPQTKVDFTIFNGDVLYDRAYEAREARKAAAKTGTSQAPARPE